MREELRALTSRGRAFLAGGVTAVVCGMLLGERDLVRIGVLVAVIPLLAAAWLARAGNRVGLVRTLSSRVVEAGQTAVVQLDVTNLGKTTGVLLVEDQVPYALGSRPRFVVDSMGTGWRRTIRYPIRSEIRGQFPIGPLRVRIDDPFGMVELHRSFTRRAELVVTPRVEPLPTIPLRGMWAGSGDNRPRAYSSGSVADVTVREYRRGDDLRRVHWRSSAHAGDLMVRREDQPWQARCTLLVDNRTVAHRGTGGTSSLETAIAAAASIGVHLTRLGYQIRLVTATGEELGHGWHEGSHTIDTTPLLHRLAVLPGVTTRDVATDWIDETVTAGLCVAVLGALGERDRGLLTRLTTGRGAQYAVVLDVGQWATRSQAPADPPPLGWLASHGWKSVRLGPRTALAQAWQELSQ